MEKKYLFSFFAIVVSQFFWAQTTETFETETVGSSSFTDDGQIFTIFSQAGGLFDVYYSATPYGWNGTSADNSFIDNSSTGALNVPVSFTISSAGSTPFNIKQFWIYLSQYNLTSLGSGGTLTVEGKLGGVSKFLATKSTGFNTSTGVNNGFTLIDFTTFGGVDNSTKNIDQLIISTTGTFAYCALDAMTWKVGTSLSTKKFLTKSKFTLSPNPANDILNINSDTASDYDIYNQLGQIIKTFTVNVGTNDINLGNINDGVYFIKAKNSISKAQKLVIKH